MPITLSQVRDVQNTILKFDQNQQQLLNAIHQNFYQMNQFGTLRKIRDHIAMTGVVWRELNEKIAIYTGDYDPLIDSIFVSFLTEFSDDKYIDSIGLEKVTERYANASKVTISKLYKYSQDLLLCVESANDDEC
ncbi:hypothetical protein ACOLZ1_000321 [Vibrio fluvialis]